ncbi:Aliphatic nitrilase [Penicillium brevicompactum]|uniref:nitrilase n=1 Tax=Penicillium brevicompactum TaxID=5074 RepID=A0A9W9R5U5_PENBR|nr:Aliphatic nitrilase [Penicillium brevicompactum]
MSLQSAHAIKEQTDLGNFTVALVRASPVNVPYPPPSNNWYGQMHDINATVDFGVKLIQRAALSGADFVAFPELWFPGYIDVNPGPSKLLDNYFSQTITVNDNNWKKLVSAARQNGVWLEFGFAQHINDHVYMGQGLVNSDGNIVQVRQKLRPSGNERTIFSDGTIDQLLVHKTPFGRLGMLECWEHMHPTMTFAVHAQLENIHIAAFPWAPDLDVDTGVTRSEVSIAAARLYAVVGSSYVFMPAVGTAAVFAPNGTTVASIQASDCVDDTPILYHSINATVFVSSNLTYDTTEYSWAALQQVNDAYPSYIPKDVNNSFIGHRQNSISEMRRVGPIMLS